MQATIFPHDEGVTVWFSGFEDDPEKTAEVLCETKEDAEALIQGLEAEFGIEIPRTWHV